MNQDTTPSRRLENHFGVPFDFVIHSIVWCSNHYTTTITIIIITDSRTEMVDEPSSSFYRISRNRAHLRFRKRPTFLSQSFASIQIKLHRPVSGGSFLPQFDSVSSFPNKIHAYFPRTPLPLNQFDKSNDWNLGKTVVEEGIGNVKIRFRSVSCVETNVLSSGENPCDCK